MGVGEALNESAFGQGLVVRGRHFLIVEPPRTSALYHRINSQQLYMHPLTTYAIVKSSYANYSTLYRQTWSALIDTLPLNIHLLTLDQLTVKEYLIRLEHYFELDEDDTYSHPTTVDLQSIFRSIGTINSTLELTLSANLELSHMQRLDWSTDDKQLSEMNISSKLFKLKENFPEYNILFFYRTRLVHRYKYHFESNANSNISCDNNIKNILK
jgi:lysosomal alpha-mannosidase